jgi:hypothetical protein
VANYSFFFYLAFGVVMTAGAGVLIGFFALGLGKESQRNSSLRRSGRSNRIG